MCPEVQKNDWDKEWDDDKWGEIKAGEELQERESLLEVRKIER